MLSSDLQGWQRPNACKGQWHDCGRLECGSPASFDCGKGTIAQAAAELPHSTRLETSRHHHKVAGNGSALESSAAARVSGRNLCRQHAECGSPPINATSKGRSQKGHAEDQSEQHDGQVFRIFCTPSRDAPFIRRSRTKRHSGLLQIKNRAMGTSLRAACDSPVPCSGSIR